MGLRSWNRCIKGLDERDKISAQITFKYVEGKRVVAVVAQVAKVWRPCSWTADMGGLFTGHN